MRPSLWYRISSVLLVLFAVAHQLGFRSVDPSWGVDSVVHAMQATHFEVQGLTRSYWDFFTAFGFFVTVLLLFAAFLAWQLAGLSKEALRGLGPVTWALALSFVAITLIAWRYIFFFPLLFSGLVALCLLMAAWRARAASNVSEGPGTTM
ncbi:MAG TPA: hypothetical protein VGV12_05565 [Gemmatimonadales bacterium]|nr:hypothetical protein [Gemmatimonadales bacterium]